MATRKRLDLNQLAKSIVDQATGEAPKLVKGKAEPAKKSHRNSEKIDDSKSATNRLA